MALLICSVFILVLWACGGNVRNVNIKEVDSDLYSTDDIHSAIDVITDDFDREWNGRTLKQIYYAGDEVTKEYQEWTERYDKDEVIVLLSSFYVNSSGGDGSLNPNSTYNDWNWILVRDSEGNWQHVDHGY